MHRRQLHRIALAALALPLPLWAANEVSPWPASRALPTVEGMDLDGRHWKVSGLKGRAVILNFWASWCEPCRAEMPTLQNLAELYGPDKLVVLAVNFKETAGRAGRFVKSTNLSLPVLLDPEGKTAGQFGITVFPTSILIAADGKPRMRVRGEVDWTGKEGEAMVAPLLSR